MTAEWKKFYETKEQLDEMRDAKYGWIVRWNNGNESQVNFGEFSFAEAKEYLICEPLPHAEMRARHARTGQPFYYKNQQGCWVESLGFVASNEYTFNPPETVKYRVALFNNGSTITAESSRLANLMESSESFVKWISEWIEVEI